MFLRHTFLTQLLPDANHYDSPLSKVLKLDRGQLGGSLPTKIPQINVTVCARKEAANGVSCPEQQALQLDTRRAYGSYKEYKACLQGGGPSSWRHVILNGLYSASEPGSH